MRVGTNITEALRQLAESERHPTSPPAQDRKFDAESDLQDDLLSDHIGRCKRPSQPPSIRKP